MSIAPDMITAAEDRPVSLRKRPDLEIHKGQFQQVDSWIVKDPISLKYHRLQDPEITVLNMLDGKVSLRDIQEKLQQRYPTKITRLSDLQYLLATFHRSGLVMAEAPGQSTQMLRRRRETIRQQWMQRLSNVLAIRFPGFDPERVLQWMHPRIGWIFEPWAMLVWLVFACSAATLLLVNWNEFQQRLPEFYQFFSLGNFFWLAIVMIVTKVGHEFGHGLSCKHFGGECHEIGVLLLVFTPALYCDTSDSWVLANKWHRAFIGAAGMYVEVFFASIATFLWWNTQPGVLHYMCLNVMFVSSVSTIVFNANPLLRYDGYYILSDLLEIPNLAQKSRLALLNFLRVTCVGLKPVSRRSLPPRGLFWFALYSIASFCYRWFVLVMILWFLFKVFKPYGLDVIGYMMIAFSLFGLIVVPIWQVGKFFAVPGRMEQVKWPRVVATMVVLGFVLAAIVWVPIPTHVGSSLVVRPDGAERVYVTVAGQLQESSVAYGQEVIAGQVLATLDSPELRLQIAKLEAELAGRSAHVDHLRRHSGGAQQSALPQAEAALASTQETLAELREDADQLTLRAPQAGTLLAPPERNAQPVPPEYDLPVWHERPLIPRNLGAWLDVDTLLGSVGDPARMKAVLVIDQSDVELVQVGRSVEIVLDEAAGTRLHGEIREIAKVDLKIPPRELTPTAGGTLPTKPGPGGTEQPMFVYYEASVPLENVPFPLVAGFRGHAKVDVGAQSLGTRLSRLVRKVIHFR